MADILKKVIVPREQLPPVGSGNKYFFRYRIVSEDGNRMSHWSPVQTSNGPVYATQTESVGAISQMGEIIMATWTPSVDIANYDIFIKFNSDPYFYSGTTNVRNYSFIKAFPYSSQTTPTSVSILIQAASQDKKLNESLTIWESESYPLV